MLIGLACITCKNVKILSFTRMKSCIKRKSRQTNFVYRDHFSGLN